MNILTSLSLGCDVQYHGNNIMRNKTQVVPLMSNSG